MFISRITGLIARSVPEDSTGVLGTPLVPKPDMTLCSSPGCGANGRAVASKEHEAMPCSCQRLYPRRRYGNRRVRVAVRWRGPAASSRRHLPGIRCNSGMRERIRIRAFIGVRPRRSADTSHNDL